ncbi:RNA-directed DNA polymerase [uncultured Bacteroides sp.]|uniref:RNA-directed DNA polymerase n=1 Tax=uncultured Bacteroides sp. TaxID=162156 RepID=UPI002AAC0EBE|nr:RNA-directed DNA polymerase [uncultured Bacteroides sp.]
MRKFYPSIDKDKLKELIRRKIKGEAALRLMNKIIDAYKPKMKRGISIGALPSQTNGNWMLTPFDYFCLDTMKVHFYERNVDDIVMGFRTKEEIAEKIPRMKAFVETLGVTVGKLIVFPVDKQKVSFCMYMHEKGHTELRPKPMRRFSKLLNHLENHPEEPIRERSRVCSYLGFLKHCDSYNILKEKRHEHSKVFSRINGCSALSNRKKRDIESTRSRDE